MGINYSSSQIESEVRNSLAFEDIVEEDTDLTAEEQECEEHFQATHCRNEEGRFFVRFPFKSNTKQLGNSRRQAFVRLTSNKRRLEKQPIIRKAYKEFIDEYTNMKYMSVIPYGSITDCMLLPHHYVEKSDRTTTKLRVVFDASAKTDSGITLNDTLAVGPKLQDDIVHLIIRFRMHPIGLTGDVAKMFRQILVHEDDRKFQHTLWRDDFGGELRSFSLIRSHMELAVHPT